MNRLIDHITYGCPKGVSMGDDVLASAVVCHVAVSDIRSFVDGGMTTRLR